MIVTANLLTGSALCSLTGKALEDEYEREYYLPAALGSPPCSRAEPPG